MYLCISEKREHIGGFQNGPFLICFLQIRNQSVQRWLVYENLRVGILNDGSLSVWLTVLALCLCDAFTTFSVSFSTHICPSVETFANSRDGNTHTHTEKTFLTICDLPALQPPSEFCADNERSLVEVG